MTPPSTRAFYDSVISDLTPEEQEALANTINATEDAAKSGIEPDMET